MIARLAVVMSLAVSVVFPMVPAAVADDQHCGAHVRWMGKPKPAAEVKTVALFVHGFNADYTYWGQEATGAVTAVHNLPGVGTYTFDYGDRKAYQWVTDPGIGPALAGAIDCLGRQDHKRVVVIAHSMGGLATQFASGYRLPNGYTGGESLAGVVTAGTPYRGSQLLDHHLGGLGRMIGASLTRWCGFPQQKQNQTCGFVSGLSTDFVRALAPGSDELKRLPDWPVGLHVLNIAGANRLSPRVHLGKLDFRINTVSVGDTIVSQESATARARHEKVVTQSCDISNLIGFVALYQAFDTACFHSNLFHRSDVRDDIIAFIERIELATRPPENCLTTAQLANHVGGDIGMFFDAIKDIVESRCDGDYAAVRAHRRTANLLGIDEYWWILRRYNGLWYPYRGVDVYRDDDLYTLPDCQGRPMQAVPARLQELVGCLNGKPVADPAEQGAIAAVLRDWHQAQLSRNTNRICGFYGPDTISRVGFDVPPCPQLLDNLRPGAWAVPPKAITIDETQIHVVGPWADVPDQAIAPSPRAGGWIGPLPGVLYRHGGDWKIVNDDVLLYGAAHPPMVFCLPFESTDQDNCRS